MEIESLENQDELCYVHERLHKNEELGTILVINKRVCVSGKEHPFEEFNGNKYCLFHLPSEEKDGRKIFQKFLERISFIEEKVKNVGNIVESERNRYLRYFVYDFRYIWFNKNSFNPMILEEGEKQNLNFFKYKFLNDVLFNFAVFYSTAGWGFAGMEFHGRADFSFVKFSFGESFKDSIFHQDAIFRNTDFNLLNSFKGAEFRGNVDFTETVFLDTDFSDSLFLKNVKFIRTNFSKFGEVSFRSSVFGSESSIDFLESSFFVKASFENCKSEGIVRFGNLKQNGKSKLDFKDAAFETTKHAAFVSCQLRPSNFINVDVRKFSLANIDWGNDFGSKDYTLTELKSIEALPNSKRLFVITCRQFAENAENNDRYEEASNFRRMAFETEWLELGDKSDEWFKNILLAKKKIESDFGYKKVDLLAPLKKTLYIISHFEFPHLFYRYLSYYGESWRRALVILLLGVFLIFPVFYMITDFQVSSKGIPLEVVVMKECNEDVQTIQNSDCKIEVNGLSPYNAILHSLTSATFQDVEYRKPISFCAELLTILEKIFAPLQAALLALAIRRKFMR